MTATPLTRPPSLIPTGTARALFLGMAAENPDDTFPHELRERLFAHDVSDATMLAAWEVTRFAPGASVAERRTLGYLTIALLEVAQSGGTFLPLGPPATDPRADPLSSSLERLGFEAEDRQRVLTLAAGLIAGTAAPAVAALFGPPGARRPFILSNGALYTERLWAAESHLVAMLRDRMLRRLQPFAGSIEDALAFVGAGAVATVTGGVTPLADEQLDALRAALTGPLTIIAGGPGSGKTSIIVALVRALTHLGISAGQIALAAPTGRAAQRITESMTAALARLAAPAPSDVDLGPRFTGAVTLHRLLGIRTGRIRALDADAPEFHAGWRLPHKVVLVDEASMIDLMLMEQLTAAVGDDARLILLGDADQLPSVEVGAVFRELVAGASRATRHLTRSHRMSPTNPDGAQILSVATALNAGNPIDAAFPVFARAADLRFAGFERLAAAGIAGFLDRWHSEILGADTHLADALDHRYAVDDTGHILDDDGQNVPRVKALLANHAAARILCVTRTAGRATSSDAVNRLVHGRVQAAAAARGAGPSLTAALVPGEPVIALRNNRARGLSNGDLGVVLRVRGRHGDALGVAFERPEGIVVHPLDELGADVSLGFALTVHKAQGSEYARVALVLPEVDVPLLSREILYTALTRARVGVVVIGDPALFATGASRTLTRTSGIASNLGGIA